MHLRKTHIALLLVVGAIAFGAIMTGTGRQTNTDTSTVISADVPVGTARLSFSKPAVTARVGEEVTIDILVDTGDDRTTGVDLVLTYDPTLLEVVDADSNTAGVQIASTNLFDFVPANEVTIASGKISFSASQQPTSQPVNVAGGKLATVAFKAKAAGQSDLIFDHTPGLLSDTNIIKANDGRDLLSHVLSGKVTVSQ